MWWPRERQVLVVAAQHMRQFKQYLDDANLWPTCHDGSRAVFDSRKTCCLAQRVMLHIPLLHDLMVCLVCFNMLISCMAVVFCADLCTCACSCCLLAALLRVCWFWGLHCFLDQLVLQKALLYAQFSITRYTAKAGLRPPAPQAPCPLPRCPGFAQPWSGMAMVYQFA